MKQQYIFNCPLTKYYIEFIVDTDTNIAFLNTLITDYQHLKPLFSLIRSSIDNLDKKNVKKIVQTVSKEDWELYLKNKTTWKIVNDDIKNQICDVECEIGSFIENFGVGIGLLQ